jgi:vacuolar-type H+-ATPase subunit I/STV1
MKTAEQYRKELKKEFPNASNDKIEYFIRDRMRMDKYYFDMCGYVPSEKMVNALSDDEIIV